MMVLLQAEPLEFRVLGPLELVVGGQRLGLGTPRQQTLLGLLLIRAGEVVSCDRLIEDLWDGDPPGTARHTRQDYAQRGRADQVLRVAARDATNIGDASVADGVSRNSWSRRKRRRG